MQATTTYRNIAPEIKNIEHVALAAPDQYHLDNGTTVYAIHQSGPEVLRLELNFQAGKFHADRMIDAFMNARLMLDGTEHYSSSGLAEAFDFYGANCRVHCRPDYGRVIIYSLSKYLAEVCALAQEVILRCTFPENEFKLAKQLVRQQFSLRAEKIEFLADKRNLSALYGAHHPYGHMTDVEDLEEANLENLHSFYTKTIQYKEPVIFICGNIPHDAESTLNNYFGLYKVTKAETPTHIVTPFSTNTIRVQKDNAVQSAIRIACPMFGRQHPDFHGMLMLNTIFGGYFGARLMQNIREDKGYTYGIYSGIRPYEHGGHFYISTEVGKDVTEAALSEIYKELDRIVAEPVDQEELDLARNYTMGSLLNGADGAFNRCDTLKGLYLSGRTVDEFQQLVKRVQTITVHDLHELAQKYLRKENMVETLAGDFKS